MNGGYDYHSAAEPTHYKGLQVPWLEFIVTPAWPDEIQPKCQ